MFFGNQPVNYRYSISEDYFTDAQFRIFKEMIVKNEPGVKSVKELPDVYLIKNKTNDLYYLVDKSATDLYYSMYNLDGNFQELLLRDINADGISDVHYDETITANEYAPGYTRRIVFAKDSALKLNSIMFTQEIGNGIYLDNFSMDGYYSKRVFKVSNSYWDKNLVYLLRNAETIEAMTEEREGGDLMYFSACYPELKPRKYKKVKPKTYYHIEIDSNFAANYYGYKKSKGEKSVKLAEAEILKILANPKAY